VAGGVAHPDFDARDLAVLLYARAATRDVSIGDATWEPVAAALSTPATAELVCVVAFYNMVARILVPARVPLDPRYQA
jgi:alkylhydroperoxidase family enzyme